MGGVAAETVVFRCAAPLRPAASAPGSTYEPQLGVSRPLSLLWGWWVVTGLSLVVGLLSVGEQGALATSTRGFFPGKSGFFF